MPFNLEYKCSLIARGTIDGLFDKVKVNDVLMLVGSGVKYVVIIYYECEYVYASAFNLIELLAKGSIQASHTIYY